MEQVLVAISDCWKVCYPRPDPGQAAKRRHRHDSRRQLELGGKGFIPSAGICCANMPKFSLRHHLRSMGNALVAVIPRPLLRAFLKTFESRPELAEAAGFHVHPRRFDSPLPLMEEIDRAKWAKPRPLPGVDLRVSSALALVEQLLLFASELDPVPYERDGSSAFWFNNLTFTDFDAAVLYTMLRLLKPKRYIELGCGFSSFMSTRALQRNHQEGTSCEAVYSDPHPALALELQGALPYGRLLRERVQELPREMFAGLQSGDVLFIDTSHVLKIQSDVEHELLRILPSLASGVWIHIHDIFSPCDYPAEWIWRPLRLGLNEQYAVECLLSGGNRYQIEIPLHWLVREHLPAMQKLFPRGRTPGQSLWIRKMQ